MQRLVLLFLFSLPLWCDAQTDSLQAISEIEMFRQQLNEEYQNPKESPLGVEASKFKGHDFFPADLRYRIQARVVKLTNPEKFLMETTTTRRPEYQKEYKITFTLSDTLCELYIYRNIELSKKEGYENYLFLPFTDPTNGFESYGGGRYLDLRTPQGDSMIIDFNQSYNPYCAYSWKYSCPVPPKENALPVKVLAGIKGVEH
jgi:hypothetical protein